MTNVKLEVCCGSAEDCLSAQRAGANRIELNCALELGGLTPSLALFQTSRKCVSLPIMVMIRPHNGAYHYSALDFDVMCSDARILLDQGADGIVFGVLNEDGTIDENRVKTLVALANGKETVFHKAIDETPNIETALQALIRCGVTRVLIGGGLGKIDHHLAFLGTLQARYGSQIQLLPGGGIHIENLHAVIKETGVSQIHMTGKRMEIHPITKNQHAVVDEATLRSVIQAIN